MKFRKAIWSSLPALPSDVEAVHKVLVGRTVRISELPRKAGLTKTRALCALDHLIAESRAKEISSGVIALCKDTVDR